MSVDHGEVKPGGRDTFSMISQLRDMLAIDMMRGGLRIGRGDSGIIAYLKTPGGRFVSRQFRRDYNLTDLDEPIVEPPISEVVARITRGLRGSRRKP